MKIKFRMTILIILVMLAMVLNGCGSNDVENISDEQDASGNAVSETPDESLSEPETYEDYIKLADTCLQTDDVLQALAVLDEGIEKLSAGAQSVEEQEIDLLSQRKAYILAGTAAVVTNITTNHYHDDGSMYRSDVSEYDENGNMLLFDEYWNGRETLIKREFDENGKERKAVFYDGDGNITRVTEYEYAENDRSVKYIDYNAAGVIDCELAYEYNENGNLIKRVQYNYNDDGSIDTIGEEKYDVTGNVIYGSYEKSGIVTEIMETEFDEDGNIIRKTQINYDEDTGEKTGEKISEYTYDEKQNRIKYDYARYEGEEKTDSFIWGKEYDKDGRETSFYLYDSEEGASYQSKTEYDENGLMINYTCYDKNWDVVVRRETEYDESGNVIRENDYDADGSLIQIYENEYDDFGSIIRQARYENDILKTEKRMSYVYHYIGNIDAEAADYIDDNLKQREIFTRFLNGQEKAHFYRNEGDNKKEKIVEETITDILNHGYSGGTITYTFLDMTGDGIEELIIRCDSSGRLCVVQRCHGILKVIDDIQRDSGGRYGDVYLVKCNGKTGIYRDCSPTRNGDEWDEYYFWDEKGRKEIFISESEYFDKSINDFTNSYYMTSTDCFEGRAITKGEYYDIKGGMITAINIDWQKWEEPDYGND